jgi:hypothetical protein
MDRALQEEQLVTSLLAPFKPIEPVTLGARRRTRRRRLLVYAALAVALIVSGLALAGSLNPLREIGAADHPQAPAVHRSDRLHQAVPGPHAAGPARSPDRVHPGRARGGYLARADRRCARNAPAQPHPEPQRLGAPLEPLAREPRRAYRDPAGAAIRISARRCARGSPWSAPGSDWRARGARGSACPPP